MWCRKRCGRIWALMLLKNRSIFKKAEWHQVKLVTPGYGLPKETEMALKINVGDILELKKQHPCGGKTFEVMRAGMDFRLKCLTCGTQVWLERPKLEKRVRKITPAATGEGEQV